MLELTLVSLNASKLCFAMYFFIKSEEPGFTKM